jgi:glycerol uptake facilitator-like aquaporin
MRRKLLAEFLGTALLLAIVVGSGIMAQRLAPQQPALCLLANSIATAAGLFVLIAALAPVSGAHFNPCVTLVARVQRRLTSRAAAGYLTAQLIGAVSGVILAHAMFALPSLQLGVQARATPGELLGECVATAGLLFIIGSPRAASPCSAAARVSLWILAAYWFTSSTSFANPAVTLARGLTATFAGIAPDSVLPFIAAQFLGAGVGACLAAGLRPAPLPQAQNPPA